MGRLFVRLGVMGILCCVMLISATVRGADLVTEPEKCLLRAAPYQYAFLEKENLLLTANSGGVYAYDVASGEQRWHRYLISTRGYQGVQFGKRQVLGWSDQGVFLLDAVTGKEVWWRRDMQCGGVNNAALSPDESQVLEMCERGSILYGVADRTQRVLPMISDFCGWLPGGRAVMYMFHEGGGGDKDPMRQWSIMDIETGTITPCRNDSRPLDASLPLLSSLGQFVELTGGDDEMKTPKISDARTGATLREFKDLGDMGRYPFWMKDGKRLFCISADHKTACVLDAETGLPLLSLSGEGHRFNLDIPYEDETGAAWAFSKDDANHRYAWNLVPDGAPRKVLDGARIAPSFFHFDLGSPRRLVATSMEEDHLWVYGVYSQDGTTRLAQWRCRTSKRFYGGFMINKALTHAAASFRSRQDNSGSPRNMSFALYTQDSETPVRSGPGKVLAISPDGRYLALQVDDLLACLYDAQAGRMVGQYAPSGKEQGRRSSNMSATFSDDGKRMALNNGEFIEVTDLSDDYPRRVMSLGDRNLWWVTLRFSPDGNRLLCGGNNCAWLFDAGSGALLRTFEETERFADLYQYQGGFWDSLANTAKDWAGMVTDRFKRGSQLEIAFSEGGSRIITHGSGQIIRVWDTESGKMLRTIHTSLPEKRNARGEIQNMITLSTNGRFAFAWNCDNNGPAGLWSLDDGTLLRKYQFPESSWLYCVPQDDGKALLVLNGGDLYHWPGAPQNTP